MTLSVHPQPAEPASAGPSRAQDDLAARLRLSVARLARRLRRETGSDISPSQLSALATIAGQGPLTLSELSAVEAVQPPTMTRVVARLEEQGLVSRTVDPADRRVAHVAATAAGTGLLDRARQRKDTYLAARLAALAPEDRAALTRALSVLERLAEQE
jgi:DNA-binding MarR family transcriptional regulator